MHFTAILTVVTVAAASLLSTTSLASSSLNGFKVRLDKLPQQGLYPFTPIFGAGHRRDNALTRVLIKSFNVWFRHVSTPQHPHPAGCQQDSNTIHFLCSPNQPLTGTFTDVADAFARLREEYHRDGRGMVVGAITTFDMNKAGPAEREWGEMTSYLASSTISLAYFLSIGPGCSYGEPIAQGRKWNPGNPSQLCFTVMIKALH